MKEKIAHLIQRFPDRAEVIKALGKSDTRFRDLLSDHYDLHRLLNRDEPPDPDAQKRYRNLEEELVRLIQGYPMA